jgi:hypothetical protein
MRNKIIGIIILFISLSLLALGIAQGQQNLISTFFDKMVVVP